MNLRITTPTPFGYTVRMDTDGPRGHEPDPDRLARHLIYRRAFALACDWLDGRAYTSTSHNRAKIRGAEADGLVADVMEQLRFDPGDPRAEDVGEDVEDAVEERRPRW